MARRSASPQQFYDPTWEADISLREARSFVGAARKLDEFNEWSPKYLLLCHAIELATKAYLMAHGHEPNLMRKEFGHDLDALFSACKQHGLTLTPLEQSMVDLIAPTHLNHETRYLRPGAYEMPNSSSLADFCEDLIQHARDDLKRRHPAAPAEA